MALPLLRSCLWRLKIGVQTVQFPVSTLARANLSSPVLQSRKFPNFGRNHSSAFGKDALAANKSARDRGRLRRQRLLQDGMCIRCGEKNSDCSFHTCPSCRARESDWKKHRRALAQLNGTICTVCLGPRDEEGYVVCSRCRIKKTNQQSRRIDQGKCRDCGKDNEGSSTRCSSCRARASDQQKHQRMLARLDGTICTVCLEPRDEEGYLICSLCRMKKNNLRHRRVLGGNVETVGRTT